MLLRRGLGKIAKFGGVFETLVNCAWVLWKGRWFDKDLPATVSKAQKTIVGTVAHGDGFYAAQRFANKHGLPLVVFFQDWWPDMAEVPKPFVKVLDKHFLSLAKSCNLGICVSDGMKKALGGGKNLEVLSPIPGHFEFNMQFASQAKAGTVFKIVYSGNLDLYGPMLLEALRVFKGHPQIQLQVRGANPNWPDEAKKDMREAGLWLEFAPRSELDAWLQSADAFLIPMVFEEKYRRRMETSFPSKLIEFSQFGKPLIVWGPDYCSALRWAEKAFCTNPIIVTKPDSEGLIEPIQQFVRSRNKVVKFIPDESIYNYNEFNPKKIQSQFFDFLKCV